MKLITEVNIRKADQNITHRDRILLLGSCFSQNIGEKLDIGGFQTLINPFGTIYNPFSIAETLDYISLCKAFKEEDALQNGDIWHLIPCHGEIFGYCKDEVLDLAQRKQDEAHRFLDNETLLLITLGTAWLYSYTPLDRVMANCHKVDSKLLSRRMMSCTEIVESLSSAIERLKKTCKCRIIFTISPVRHWKEGFRDNLLSKSALHIAVSELCNKGLAEYFPAYEVVFDQLRDYRFYSDDLLHPNNQAISVIWEKFCDTYFDQSTKALCQKCERLHSMQNHRPLYPQSAEYERHLLKTDELSNEIKSELNKMR
ncbi:MAG: GSCFA domain-containing protein [Bacteroidales bacterium]|nr:GSCFA domain-containing protein [Bacteroidales bacterium]